MRRSVMSWMASLLACGMIVARDVGVKAGKRNLILAASFKPCQAAVQLFE